MIQAKVKCPRCGRTWIVLQGESEVDCNCHTYCEEGSKPGDCSLTPVALNHEVGWPYGVHVGSGDFSDYPMQVQYYCSTHSRYGYKVPITIAVDWTRWRSGRAPKKYRLLNK
jgi:hypothetical protein